MLIKAKAKYIRIAPRKVRLVADVVRGTNVVEAEKLLQFTVKRGASPILKLLNSAVANAEHNFNAKKEDLYIAEIKVEGGPIIKRFRPRARGSASAIQKRTSHIIIGLQSKVGDDSEEGKKATKKKSKIKTVYQSEKPKEIESKDAEGKEKKVADDKKVNEKLKEKKAEKQTIFRRKSI